MSDRWRRKTPLADAGQRGAHAARVHAAGSDRAGLGPDALRQRRRGDDPGAFLLRSPSAPRWRKGRSRSRRFMKRGGRGGRWSPGSCSACLAVTCCLLVGPLLDRRAAAADPRTFRGQHHRRVGAAPDCRAAPPHLVRRRGRLARRACPVRWSSAALRPQHSRRYGRPPPLGCASGSGARAAMRRARDRVDPLGIRRRCRCRGDLDRRGARRGADRRPVHDRLAPLLAAPLEHDPVGAAGRVLASSSPRSGRRRW